MLLWTALALVLVIEGLFPFASPAGWRRMFSQIMQWTDGQIRWAGTVSIACGLLTLWVLSS